MNEPDEKPIDRMRARGQVQDWNLLRAVRFEESKLRYLLQTLGQPRAEALLRGIHRRATGGGLLTFALFNDRFPAFPAVLAANELPGVSLHTDARATLTALSRKWRTVPFVAAFEVFYETAGDAQDRDLALVFPRRGFRHGLVIHTASRRLAGREFADFAVVHPGTAAVPEPVFVRPFRAFAEGLRGCLDDA